MIYRYRILEADGSDAGEAHLPGADPAGRDDARERRRRLLVVDLVAVVTSHFHAQAERPAAARRDSIARARARCRWVISRTTSAASTAPAMSITVMIRS